MGYVLWILFCLCSLIADLRVVGSLQCFKCNSATDNTCLYPSQQTTVVTCTNNATSCYSTSTLANYVTTVLVRDCATAAGTSCYRNDNDVQYVITSYCTGNLCNGNSFDMSSVTYQYPRCHLPAMSGKIICDSCSYSTGQISTCSSNAAASSLIYCPTSTSQCTVKGVWLLSDNSIYSFARGCTAINSQAYGVTTDAEFRTWVCYCSTDYCNSANSGTSAACNPPPARQFPYDYYDYYANNSATKISIITPWRTVLRLIICTLFLILF